MTTYTLKSLQDATSSVATQLSDGSWVAARPLRAFGFIARLKEAWLVLTDKVDTVRWPGGQ